MNDTRCVACEGDALFMNVLPTVLGPRSLIYWHASQSGSSMAQNLISLAGSLALIAAAAPAAEAADAAAIDDEDGDDVAPGTAFNAPGATVDFSA